jgi:spermidine synthase
MRCALGGWRATLLFGLLAALAIGPGEGRGAAPGRGARGAVSVELDVTSKFSHIRVKRQGSIYALVFVRDNGEEAIETEVNLKKPYDLLVPYTRFMFASYLFRPEQQRVLIVGLGGGAMVHFLKHYDADLRVDVVEIDPEVVQIAERYFGVRSEGKVKIITADGLDYLEKTETRYDVIYMDAFLKPAADTDSTGLPLGMKTRQFYKGLQDRLMPEGLVVFNLNRCQSTDADVEAIRSAFPQVYVFRAPLGNVVVVASTAAARTPVSELRARAKEADQRFKATFSFSEMVTHLAR